MEQTRVSPRSLLIPTGLALMAFCGAAQALSGLREAAVGLERQLNASATASQAFSLPLLGSSVVLAGEATLEPIEKNRCRRTLELVHDQPFERRGLRITNLSRRSVQDGPCHNFADAMAAQAEASAKSIAEQIGLAPEGINTAPGARVLVAQVGPAANARLNESAVSVGAAVALTVLEKAIIRDAPHRDGEKLSRADVGTRLKAQRIPGNADWFVLDGGLRFISSSVVDVTETAAIAAAPARGDTSRIRLKVMERAVLRNAPSFSGRKVASLAAGVERLARKVPGMAGWFELTDSDNSYPLYIHESVVALKPSDKRL
ncbi:MAG: hypothetical protein V4709_14515 [Pseudomonadota bacterium]